MNTRKVYLNMLGEFARNKQLFKLHAHRIVNSIEHLASLSKVSIEVSFFALQEEINPKQKKAIKVEIILIIFLDNKI